MKKKIETHTLSDFNIKKFI